MSRFERNFGTHSALEAHKFAHTASLEFVDHAFVREDSKRGKDEACTSRGRSLNRGEPPLKQTTRHICPGELLMSRKIRGLRPTTSLSPFCSNDKSCQGMPTSTCRVLPNGLSPLVPMLTLTRFNRRSASLLIKSVRPVSPLKFVARSGRCSTGVKRRCFVLWLETQAPTVRTFIRFLDLV